MCLARIRFIFLGGCESCTGSNSLTQEQYDSIMKFKEQRGIISDQETREKVLSMQHKQADLAERQLCRGTITTDISSDSESSVSGIPGSSPLTSSDFSELDQDLTDQEDDKMAAQTIVLRLDSANHSMNCGKFPVVCISRQFDLERSRYTLASSVMKHICERVEDEKEKYQDELPR